MKIGSERGPVVVDIEQADVEVPGWGDIQPPAHFHRKSAIRSLVTADSADGGVCARSPKQGFSKRGCAPSIMPTVKVAGPVMISVEHILGATDRHDVVASVRGDLQPRFCIPAKRP